MLTIKPVDPTQDEVRHLIEQLDEYQSGLYPPESNHLDSIEELSKSNAFFLAAYRNSEICGIGSVKIIEDYGEIKRVYVPQKGPQAFPLDRDMPDLSEVFKGNDIFT